MQQTEVTWRTGMYARHILHAVPDTDAPRSVGGGALWRSGCGMAAAGPAHDPETWPGVVSPVTVLAHRVCLECQMKIS
ncbi:hypothetical protein GCM10010174_61280 [Kutzneria viridogrisea]|uniref:Uncharacterized protein n=1 Tax=Kutzneria viridogrisea TaxID=47990 RepID=A0ABR6BH41_9PSEU|nr:hypothetical protein [Kutzneria viridogrisea]